MENEIENILSQSSVLKVGKVISVRGRTIEVQVDREKNTSHLFFKGKLVKSIVVGSYIKIAKGFEELVGKIEGEHIIEDVFQSKKNYRNDTAKIKRILSISLLGYLHDDIFERGIKELPLIDNECFLLDENEFVKVHNFIKQGDTVFHLGQLAQERGMPINLGVNGLFASHIGIFGNTGSGKSYTLAHLYNELLQKYKNNAGFQNNAEFFLIDFNGEYVADNDEYVDNIIVEPQYKTTYKLSTKVHSPSDKFPINNSLLNDVSLWKIILEATEKTQTPFINRSLADKYLDSQMDHDDKFNQYIQNLIKRVLESNSSEYLDLPSKILSDLNDVTDGSVKDLLGLISKFREHLNYHGGSNNNFYLRVDGQSIYINQSEFYPIIMEWFGDINFNITKYSKIKLIRIKFLCKYYDEIIRGYSNVEHLAPLIKRMETQFPNLEKLIEIKDDNQKSNNFTIVSLKDVNIHMRKILPLLFCKQLYENKKSPHNPRSYLNIIIDEAHNILSETSQRESEQWKDYRLETFEEIIKEGRKFGVFLTIASQRPSDISSTILSQLHNYFLHRLINNNDIKAIEKTVSYLDKVSFDSLPILPTGSCILAGLVAQVPVVVEINKIEEKYKPANQTISPTKFWQ
jgi:DNA helicase HerA-like ATPase